MALAQEKRGGPYTRDERAKRQNEVQRLHFEYGYSASKISEMMKINRNTISDDIKFLYSNIKEELKHDSEELILRQIGRLESQRTRIVKSIVEEKVYNIKNEKLLLDVDAKINGLLVKVKGQIREEPQAAKQNDYRDFVLYLLVKHNRNTKLSKEQIISEIINTEQCSLYDAENIFSDIEELGLNCCRKFSSAISYDLIEFAFLRRYLTPDDPFVAKIHALFIVNLVCDGEVDDLKKRYVQEHGSREKWPEEVFEKYDKEETEHRTKRAETISKIVAEALENLSDKKLMDKYIHYINVFFAEKESQFDKMARL